MCACLGSRNAIKLSCLYADVAQLAEQLTWGDSFNVGCHLIWKWEFKSLIAQYNQQVADSTSVVGSIWAVGRVRLIALVLKTRGG